VPQQKEPKRSWGLAELEESLAVTSKSRGVSEGVQQANAEKRFCSG